MEKKPYEKPTLTTYSESEILAIIGPAQTIVSGAVGQQG